MCALLMTLTTIMLAVKKNRKRIYTYRKGIFLAKEQVRRLGYT